MSALDIPGFPALQCVISSLRDTAHFTDEEGELTNQLRDLRDWLCERAAVQAAQPEAVGEVVDMKYNCVRFYRKPNDPAKPYLQPGTKLYAAPPSAATPEPMSAPTAEPVATDPEDCRAWCPRCDGAGDEVQMSDSSPDAHEVTVNCRHCDGNGTLYAAYTGVVRELAKKHQAYIKACGEIYFSKLATPPSAATPEPSDAATEEVIDYARAMVNFYRERGEFTPVMIENLGESLDDFDAIRATKGGKL